MHLKIIVQFENGHGEWHPFIQREGKIMTFLIQKNQFARGMNNLLFF